MFKALELGFRNFQSYGNNMTKISLDFGKPKLIIGRNLDSAVDGQVDGNGAGKSSILNALCYVLYDKTISGISKTEVINNINEENLEVYIIFQKKDAYYKVERYRKNKAKGGDGVKLFKRTSDTKFTEDDDITPAGVSNINEEISRIIGIPFEIFVRIVVFDANYEPFLNMELGDQREVIEELFGFTELSLKAELLKKEITNNKKDFDHYLELNEQTKKAKNAFLVQKQNLITKRDNWETEKQTEIQTIETQLEALAGIDFNEQEELFVWLAASSTDLANAEAAVKELDTSIKQNTLLKTKAVEWEANNLKEIKSVREQIEAIPEVDVEVEKENISLLEDISVKLKEIQTEKSVLETKKSTIQKEQAKYLKDQTSLQDNKCPFCSQQFKDAAEKLQHTNSRLSEIETELADIETGLATLDKNSKKYTKAKAEVEATSTFKTLKQIFDYEASKDKLTSKLRLLTETKNPHVNGLYDMFVDDLEFKISTASEQLTEAKDKVSSVKTDIEAIAKKLKFKSESELAVSQQKVKTYKEALKKAIESVNPFDSMLEDLDKAELELGEDRSQMLADLEDSIFHKEFLVKLLTKKDSFIRKALLNKGLPLLNSKLKYYLNKTGLPHKVEFQQDMTVKITQFKTPIGYKLLSSGQKARLNLALMFSFRDVLQARHGIINLCVLDECLDRGLSNVGVQLACKMIKQIASDNKLSMLVISHRDEIATMFDDKIEIELDKGFSRVVSGN
jgi:DNA repair exonuclease SbcCD ATPase subunit